MWEHFITLIGASDHSFGTIWRISTHPSAEPGDQPQWAATTWRAQKSFPVSCHHLESPVSQHCQEGFPSAYRHLRVTPVSQDHQEGFPPTYRLFATSGDQMVYWLEHSLYIYWTLNLYSVVLVEHSSWLRDLFKLIYPCSMICSESDCLYSVDS